MTTWNLVGTQKHILICNGSSCMRKGGEEVTLAIRDEINKHELDSHIHTTRTRCNGRCKDACVVIVYPEGTWYRSITPEIGRCIVKSHLVNQHDLLDAMIYKYSSEGFVKVTNIESPEGISKIKERN